MNKIIKDQLAQCSIADIPDFEPTDTIILIPKKVNGSKGEYEIGHTYLIELEDYLMHPSNNFNLHETWNNGRIPQSKYLKIVPSLLRGKMIQFDAVGTDFDGESSKEVYMNYWLPLKSIKLKRKLD